MATDLNYFGSVAWLAPEGFDFRKHASLIGPYSRSLRELRDLEEKLDNEECEPTSSGLVFWIPRVIPRSNKRTANGQINLLRRWRKKYELPKHHLKSYGTLSLLSGLMLLHYRLTRERVPSYCCYVRTDTERSWNRFSVGGGGQQWLHCMTSIFPGGDDEVEDESLFAFPLGSESLEPGELKLLRTSGWSWNAPYRDRKKYLQMRDSFLAQTGTPQFRALADTEVPARLADTLVKWRKMAVIQGYSGPIAWLAPEGFNFRKHAPLVFLHPSPYESRSIDRRLRNKENEPTKRQLIFWIPCFVARSNNKTREEQLILLAGLRRRHKLPGHHLTDFGTASLLSGLMLLHYRLIQAKMSLKKEFSGYRAVTDTILGYTPMRVCNPSGILNIHTEDTDHCSVVLSFTNYGSLTWDLESDEKTAIDSCFPLGKEDLNPGELDF